MNTENKNLANVGVGVDIKLTPESALYIVLIIIVGSAAFFIAKKYIQ